jgi:hypothetical protein
MANDFRNAVRRKAVIDALVNGESGAPELERALAVAFFDAFCVFQDRQKKYGPNNIAKRREAGIIVRLDDKLARLAKVYLDGSGGEALDESIEDSWMDGINYAAIGLLLHRKAWPTYIALPVSFDVVHTGLPAYPEEGKYIRFDLVKDFLPDTAELETIMVKRGPFDHLPEGSS